MIAVRGRGRSFTKLGDYLANGTVETREFNRSSGVGDGSRVAFVVTGNMLMNDSAYARTDPAEQATAYAELIAKAAKVMAWTAQHAAELKELAGESNRGRKSEQPVFHYALSWKSGETPEQAHMIAFAHHVIEKLGFGEREFMIVGHNDTDHRHLHIVANAVDPLTGKSIKSGFDKLDLSRLALEYEREHGIQCAEREKNWERREQGELVKHEAADKVVYLDDYRQQRIDRHNGAEALVGEKAQAAEDAERQARIDRYTKESEEDRAKGEDYRAKEPEWEPTAQDYYLRDLEKEYGAEKVARFAPWMLEPGNAKAVRAAMAYERRKEYLTERHEQQLAQIDKRAEVRRDAITEEFTRKEAGPAREALQGDQAEAEAGFLKRQRGELDVHNALMGRMYGTSMAEHKARLDEIRDLLRQPGPLGVMARYQAGGAEALREEITALRASYADAKAKWAQADEIQARAQLAESEALSAKQERQRDELETRLSAKLDNLVAGSDAYYRDLHARTQKEFEAKETQARREFESRMLSEFGLKTVHAMHADAPEVVKEQAPSPAPAERPVETGREGGHASGEGQAQGSRSGAQEQSSFAPADEQANDSTLEQDRGLSQGLGLGR